MKVNPVRILLFLTISFVSIIVLIGAGFGGQHTVDQNFVFKILLFPDYITSLIYSYLIQLKFIRSIEFLLIAQLIWSYILSFIIGSIISWLYGKIKKRNKVNI